MKGIRKGTRQLGFGGYECQTFVKYTEIQFRTRPRDRVISCTDGEIVRSRACRIDRRGRGRGLDVVLIAGAVTYLPDAVVGVVFSVGFDAYVAFIASPELPCAAFEPKDVDVAWY